MDDYCNCHMKHAALLERLEKDTCSDSSYNKNDHELLWTAVKSKISAAWLFALIPVIMAWIGFQVVIYDSVKNVETKVAVIQAELKAYTDKGVKP